jgi:hypothetical protein
MNEAGSYPMTDCGISDVELSGAATTVLVKPFGGGADIRNTYKILVGNPKDHSGGIGLCWRIILK